MDLTTGNVTLQVRARDPVDRTGRCVLDAPYGVLDGLYESTDVNRMHTCIVSSRINKTSRDILWSSFDHTLVLHDALILL